MRSFAAAAIVAASVVPACSSSDDGTAAPLPFFADIDGSARPDGDASAGGDEWDGSSPPQFGLPESGPHQCSMLTPPSAGVLPTKGVTKPTPAGGMIVDGTYILTKAEVFPPSTPGKVTQHVTLRFSAGHYAAALAFAGDLANYSTVIGTFTVDGTAMTLTENCPAIGYERTPMGFTATPTEIVNIDGDYVSTYTKQ